MKRTTRWLAWLLTAVLLVCTLPPALAVEDDPWAGAEEVSSYEAFQAALENEEVTAIKITGEVEVPESKNLEANKPVLIGIDGSLSLAEGAVLTSNVQQGLFNYEDSEHTWTHVAEGMAAFLLWYDPDSGAYFRALYGTQPEDLGAVLSGGEHGSLFTAVFSGDVALTGEVEVNAMVLYMMGGGTTLTVGENASLTVQGYLHVEDGDLVVADGASLEIGDSGWVNGDVTFEGTNPSMPENLNWSGEARYTHLVALWYDEDGNVYQGGHDDGIWMTPLDEYEVVFALMCYDEDASEWTYDDEIEVAIPEGLDYAEREDGQKRILTTEEWNQEYEITYGYGERAYSLPVHVELPDVGYYSAPEATEENYINGWDCSPISGNTFYLCVRPDAWFMTEEGYTLADTLEYAGDEEAKDLVSAEKVKNGVWKITVSGCDFYAEHRVNVLRGDKVDGWAGQGLWIGTSDEQLVYSEKALHAEAAETRDISYTEDLKDSIRDTLAMNANTSRDVVFYLLRYGGENEGWVLEFTDAGWVRGDGVTVAQVSGEDDTLSRVTAGSAAGNYSIVRLDGKWMKDGEALEDWTEGADYLPIENSTRGLPLTVTVTDPTPVTPSRPSGGSASGSSSGRADASVSGTGGSVTAKSDGTVTITPDKGYEIDTVTVNGKRVAVPRSGRLTGLKRTDKVVVTFARIAEEPALPFTDVQPGTQVYDAVLYVYEKGLFAGTTAATFTPDGPMTRQMLMTVLARLDGADTSGSPYAKGMAWAVENGVSDGSAPAALVSRQQVVTMLYRCARLRGADVSAAADLSVFPDADKVSAYAADAMRWAVAAGIITGKTDGTLDPCGQATRAQAAIMLMRYTTLLGA